MIYLFIIRTLSKHIVESHVIFSAGSAFLEHQDSVQVCRYPLSTSSTKLHLPRRLHQAWISSVRTSS